MALEKIKPRVVDETQNYTFNNVTATGNVVSLNANLGNLAEANFFSGTLTTSAQPNITTVGSLGDLTVVGIAAVGNLKTDNLLYANGVPWPLGGVTATVGGSNSQVQFNDGGVFGAVANFTFDKSTNTLVTDNFVGSGSGLSNITAGNINGQVSNAVVAGTVYSSSQPNITSVGTLVNVEVTGNVTAGNASLGNLVVANFFSGNGSGLGSIVGANVTGQVGYAAVANSVSGSNVSGAVTYAATANAVAGANVLGAVSYATTANSVAGANVTGYVANANHANVADSANAVAGANVSGEVGYAAVANSVAGANVSGAVNLATYAGTANAVAGANVSGEVSYAATANSVAGGNVTGAVSYATTANSVAGANVSGAVSYATTANSVAGANVSGQVGNALVAGTVYTASQPNITSVGTLSSLTVSGSTNLGNVGNVKITGGSSGYILQTDGAGNLQWVDNLPSTVTYNANSIALTNGVYVSGSITGIQTFGDYASGNVYVLTDGTGSAPAWYVDIDFITVASFNRVVLNINYTQSSGHTIYVQLYNNTTSAWDSIGTYTGLGSYYAFALEVIDGTPYINGSSKVQLRLYHSNAGNSSHQTSIDYAALELSSQGPQGPRGPTGATGSTGSGVVTGGTTGQVLIKNSSTNYDTAWTSDLTGLSNVTVSNQLNVSSTTNSTGTGTGAIVTAGGASIGKDLFVGGNLYVPNLISTSTTTLNVAAALLYLTAEPTYPYNYDIGFYSHFTGGPSNNYQHSGLVRNHSDNTWVLFSNVPEPSSGIVDLANANLVYDKLKLGDIEVHGAANISGNIVVANANLGNLATANFFSGNGSALSSITGGNVTGTVANATYATSAGTVGVVTANAQPNITSVGTLSSLAVTGNITSGNANLGNAVSANYFVGNGVYLTGLTSSGMSNGTSNVSIPAASGNVNISVAGNANVFKVTGTGVNVAGTGNFSGGITAGANINAGTNYILGNGYYLTDVITGVGDTIANGNSNITVFSTTVGISANATANVMLVQKTGVNVAGYVNASGNLVGANANLGNLAVANYFQGNGSLLTGITVSAGNSIVNGNSNVSVVANANVNISSTGNANVVVITGTGMNVAGTVNATGNITAAYLIGNGSQLTGITAGSTLVSGNSNVVLDANANLRISITSTANVVTVSTNSVNIAGNVVATGNSNLGNSVTSNYFVGNGSLLTGIGGAGYIFNGNSNVNIGAANANVTVSVANVSNVVVISNTTMTMTGNIISGNVYSNTGTIGAQTLIGTLNTANQYNITTVGTLGNLSVTSNITAANATLTGNVFANTGIIKAQYLKGDGSNITGIGGAGYIFNGSSNVAIPDVNGNVYITVGSSANLLVVHSAGANLTGNANVSGFVAVTGNVTAGNATLGNAATANYFVGNLYGLANTAVNVTASSQPNITSVGNLTTLTVEGVANLGTLSNVKIGGGASGYFLKTDGSGNLSWAVPAGGGGSGGTSLTYTAGTTPPGSGNILGDQWFNTATSVLYEYINDGTSSYWVDVSTPSTTTLEPTTLDLANVTIAGGTAGQVLTTDGAGNLSFATISTSSISNGNSNISVYANGNIAFSSTGTSNVFTITGAGIQLTGTANLGAASNLTITGGANNQVLTSNGAGGVSWQEPQNSIHPFLLMGA